MDRPVSDNKPIKSEASPEEWLSYLKQGGTLGKLRQVNSDQMEAMYTLGYGHFGIGHYADALRVFRYLAMLDHWNARYFLAIGYCLYQLKHYGDAIPALSYAERLDKQDPRPSLCMTECFISLKNRKLAKKALAEAIKRLKVSKDWDEEKKQAKQLKHYLVNQSGRSQTS